MEQRVRRLGNKSSSLEARRTVIGDPRIQRGSTYTGARADGTGLVRYGSTGARSDLYPKLLLRIGIWGKQKIKIRIAQTMANISPKTQILFFFPFKEVHTNKY